ncbi:MAG: ATP-binding protein [Candidatus Peribacteraceae bacterium]|nr:ATP-binding protein [Candidatus Peribacteraceae bacterium]
MRQDTLFATGIVIVLTLLSFVMARSALQQRVLAQLSGILFARETLLEQALQSAREEAALLGSRSELVRIAQGGELQGTLEAMLINMRDEHMPAQAIAVFDRTGTLRGSVGTSMEAPFDATQATILQPITGDEGWKAYRVFAPIRSDDGKNVGAVGIEFDVVSLLQPLLSATSLGETGEILLAMEKNNAIILLHHRYSAADRRIILLGSLDDQYAFDLPLAQALKGETGIRSAEDYAGKKVFSAYRLIPVLGWGLEVKVDRTEALRSVTTLAVSMGVAGALLTMLAVFVTRLLALRLTQPLIRLSGRVSLLRPGNWSFRSSVRSGDEVEVLDRVVEDLAARLKMTYDHLEDEVTKRTAELREQYVKDRAILESIEHGVVAVDRRGKILDINPSVERLLGVEREMILGESVSQAISFCIHRKPCPAKKHPVMQALEKREPIRAATNMHMNIVRADRGLLPVNVAVTPLLVGRKLLGAVLVFQDMTDDRRIDYIKSEFISLASHQLRTPISTLRWYIELLSDGKNKNLTQVQRESIVEMQTAATRMADLVEALLHAARLEGGSITPKLKKVNITALLTNIAEELRALGKDAKISCAIDIPTKPVMIMTDAILVHIVLQNLFSNAVKYSHPNGQVNVKVRVRNGWVEIEVTDRGIGIPTPEQHRIFERLFRARNATTVDTDGNGLGLFISHMIVDILGGKISFKSMENKGSAFTVRLPMGTKKSGVPSPASS